MGQTSIEYVTHSWNPIVGCSHAGSPGCDNCYAARLAATRLKHHPLYKGLAELKNGVARWTGEIRISDKAFDAIDAKKPRRFLVCSMGDVALVGPPAFAWLFKVMEYAPQHRFLLLTKRPEKLLECHRWMEKWADCGQWPAHIWPGVTVETQDQIWRIEELLKIPAAGYWVSLEPCLGLIEIPERYFGYYDKYEVSGQYPCYRAGIDFVVLGGETGPNARPMHPDWARKVRNDCMAVGVSFFFKNWGSWHPAVWLTQDGELAHLKPEYDDSVDVFRDGQYMFPVAGKGKAGRLLDGQVWEQLPESLLLPDEVAST